MQYLTGEQNFSLFLDEYLNAPRFSSETLDKN